MTELPRLTNRRSVDGIISSNITYQNRNATIPTSIVNAEFEDLDRTVIIQPKADNKSKLQRFIHWLSQVSLSAIILAIMLFIIVNFYIFASLVNFNKFFYIFLILSLLTDGLFVLIHLFRREMNSHEVTFDPSTLTILIACYNGQDVIGETLKQCLLHVPADQIIVVSDASTDNTAETAASYGVRVHINKKNLNKAFSVNAGMELVKTPYVLLLDDDVLIGNAVIPTSLLDQGYSAVAFDVMPLATESIVNHMQRFEYRNSMHMGKNLRGSAGAVGNVSGAIGLYRTSDLIEQGKMHSGQFAGEDEQRTLLAHIYGTSKGVTYSNETVVTIAPSTFYALYRQRAYSWSLAVPELFTLYWRIILSPDYHYLLKAEKAYYLYIYLTDPLRLLFLWALVLRPKQLLMTYLFYLGLNVLVWFKTKRKDHFIIIMLYPFYILGLGICRFIGNFYWLKVKFNYLRNRTQRQVHGRRLVAEYTLVFAVFVTAWVISGYHFSNDIRLFNKIRGYRLEDTSKSFKYDVASTGVLSASTTDSIKVLTTAPASGTYITVMLEKGDTNRAIAYKAVTALLAGRPDIKLDYDARIKINDGLTQVISQNGIYISPSASVLIETTVIEQSITKVTNI